MYFSQEEFLKIFEQSNYSLFDIPSARFCDLFDAEPISVNFKNYKEVGEYLQKINYQKRVILRTDYSIRIGNPANNKELMFTYCKNIVPIECILIFMPEEKRKINNKVKIFPSYFSFRFYASTIDDASDIM